jgi:diguanylate cyclase (GGDEF)-like protein
MRSSAVRSVVSRAARAPAHRKVALLAAALIGLMVVVGAVAAGGLRSVRGDLDDIATHAAPAGLALGAMSENVAHAQLSLEQSSVLAGDTVDLATLDEFDDSMAAIDENFATFRELLAASALDPVDSSAFEAAVGDWRDRAAAYSRDLRRGATTSPETQLVLRAHFEQVHGELSALDVAFRASLRDAGERATSGSDDARRSLLIVAVLNLLVGLVISRSSYHASRAQHRELVARDAARDAETQRRAAEARLNRAFEQIQNEEQAVGTVALALVDMAPGRASELLLADSSDAHLHAVSRTDGFDERPGCGVATPRECPAVNKSRTLTFEDSTTFDACPHLRARTGPPSSAVCVPVAINGTASGVLHSVARAGASVGSDEQRLLELIASRAGDRIGVLRAFKRSESQAATDPLTGLDNRRSFENRVSEILAGGRSVALAFGDLDHFKKLNDTHGHDAGDRALRAFARTLRHAVRPDDLVARWGGEEFVVVFPDTTREAAAHALERVQSELARVVAAGGIPPFTVSFGVSDRFDGDELEPLVAAADRALLQAKELGRNRVVVSGAHEAMSASGRGREQDAVGPAVG